MENEEIKNNEVKDEEVVQSEESQEVKEEVNEKAKQDRPDINYRKELERKNKELDKLRQEHESLRSSSKPVRDPDDIRTWSDRELKAIVNSNDPSTLAYKESANDELLERKVKSIRERERMDDKRALSEMELRSKFPDAMDHTSELALKMEQVMYEYDLQKTPAGRLAAAKIAAAELGLGTKKSQALARKNEDSRVSELKKQVVDGDRAKSVESSGSFSPKKLEDLENRIKKEDAGAVGEVLKARGISRDTFFPR